MNVIITRNVNCVLPRAIETLLQTGTQRDSRNGPVLQSPVPVSTVYQRPMEKVVFWPERDANPFFHLYESLWMLAGRNDVAPLTRYAKQMANYSDDGKTLHGAYGHRWRWQGHDREYRICQFDQLAQIAKQLTANKEDRRAVLQMWHSNFDLGRSADRGNKDLPCNLTATFQIGTDGRLDLVVFCRSNDIIWGAYGANAVHFAFLLEYMAHWIGVDPGTYTQISVNWHGYLNTLEPLRDLPRKVRALYSVPSPMNEPYTRSEVSYVPMFAGKTTHKMLDEHIQAVSNNADNGFTGETELVRLTLPLGMLVIHDMLHAHHLHKQGDTQAAFELLDKNHSPSVDWIRAGMEWLTRRETRKTQKIAQSVGRGNPHEA